MGPRLFTRNTSYGAGLCRFGLHFDESNRFVLCSFIFIDVHGFVLMYIHFINSYEFVLILNTHIDVYDSHGYDRFVWMFIHVHGMDLYGFHTFCIDLHGCSSICTDFLDLY